MNTIWKMLVRGAVISTLLLPAIVVCVDYIFIVPPTVSREVLLMIIWAVGVLWFGAVRYAEFGQ